MLNMLIGPVADLAGTWLNGKVEEKKAQSATKVARAQAEAVVMQKKATGEIDWDLEMAKGSQSSWKDEWLGFPQIEQMPEWYQYSLGGFVSASFWVRSATKVVGKK